MILDTCALVWLVCGDPKISIQTKKRIDEAAFVYVSSISAFEIAHKYNSGKISLPCKPDIWFKKALHTHDLVEIKIDWKIAVKATSLPAIHKDPCDRFIIATAILRKLTIVTADSLFSKYKVQMIC